MKLKQQIHNVYFLNPRRLGTFHNWPSPLGPIQRDFGVLEDDAGRQRVITWTNGKPRLMAGWHDWARIVDGSDGLTYVVGFSGDLRLSPVDNQGRWSKIEGRAVIYRPNPKPVCVELTTPGFHCNQIQELARLSCPQYIS